MVDSVAAARRFSVAVTDLRVCSPREVSNLSQPETLRDLHEDEYRSRTCEKLRTFIQNKVRTVIRAGALYSTEILSTDDLSQFGTGLHIRTDSGGSHKLGSCGLHHTDVGLRLSCRHRLWQCEWTFSSPLYSRCNLRELFHVICCTEGDSDSGIKSSYRALHKSNQIQIRGHLTAPYGTRGSTRSCRSLGDLRLLDRLVGICLGGLHLEC